MRAKKIAQTHSIGFVISYEPSEDRLTLLSGGIYGEVVGGFVSESEDRSEKFEGDLSDQNGTTTFIASPDWDPDEAVCEDVLVVRDPDKMKFRKLPNHQPKEGHPLSLFVGDRLVDQGDWEVSYKASNPSSAPDFESFFPRVSALTKKDSPEVSIEDFFPRIAKGKWLPRLRALEDKE